MHCFILVNIEAVHVLHGFTQNFKKKFSAYKSMEANDPQGMANLDPRGISGTIYVGDH